MVPASYFALPLATWQLPKSSQSDPRISKKRKRGRTDTEHDHEEDDAPPEGEPPMGRVLSSQASEYSAVLSPDERTQYRAAGQPLDEEVPAHPFPHAPFPRDHQRHALHTLGQVASSISPPSTLNEKASPQNSLRFQHLRVLTTILHRCLIEGDFIRAGRAWGMILRHEFGGHAVDIRTEGRWGIGAEILLRRGAQSQGNVAAESRSSAGASYDMRGLQPKSKQSWFTRSGFEEAKRYYERLIVQFPYHQRAPHGINALDFYPAMFGLWIYVVQEETKRITSSPTKLGRQPTDIESDEAADDTSESAESAGPSIQQPGTSNEALLGAREIAARMDTLMASPPFSDNLELLRLRAMVALWIADLCKGDSLGDDMRDLHLNNERDQADLLEKEVAMVDIDAQSSQRGLANSERVAALAQAQELLTKAQARGGNSQGGRALR